MTVLDGEWYVERARLDGSVDRKTGRFRVRPFAVQPAYVKAEGGATVKTAAILDEAQEGSAVYVRLYVGLTMPCYPVEADIDATTDEVSAWLAKRIDAEIKEIQRERAISA